MNELLRIFFFPLPANPAMQTSEGHLDDLSVVKGDSSRYCCDDLDRW